MKRWRATNSRSLLFGGIVNSIQFHIKQDGTWQRLNATPVFPFSIGELLDERLDEAYITVYDCPLEHLPRLSEIRATIYNGNKTKQEFFIIASDGSIELPAGSGRYKHDIYLIERTKLLEGIFCSSLTFTNALPFDYGVTSRRVYAQNLKESQPLPTGFDGVSFITSPVISSNGYTVPSVFDVGKVLENYFVNNSVVSTIYVSETQTGDKSSVTVYLNNSIYANEETESLFIPSSELGRQSNLTLVYKVWSRIITAGTTEPSYVSYLFSFDVGTYINRLPLKRWTITDCITRCCELAEPLFNNETPKYRLDGVEYGADGNVTYTVGSLAEKYDKIYAPEFTLTQDTLREQLRVILSYVHAEPWLDENDVIRVTEYGRTVQSVADGLPYVYSGAKSHINEYCTEIRSHAQNLVSSLGYAKGTMIDPGNGLYRSTRTDVAYTRITEGNGVARTEKPIYSINKVMCGIANPAGTWYLSPVEITPYVFESTEYGANLSPYKGGFPYSRAYAIYYTMGQPNIQGLFYQAPDAIDKAKYSPYSICNILSSVTGRNAEDIYNRLTETGGAADLVFSVTYKPISNHFVSHGKSLYVEGEKPFMQLYNQSENLVESQYYGENIKGVAARLGNVEEERTFILRDIDDIPRVGDMLDEYAISAVSSEIYPFDIKCTVGLSKDFNRISEYVGINSQKRMYEVSERQATQRDILIKETLVIGTKPEGHSNDERIFRNMAPFYQLFNSQFVLAPENVLQYQKVDFRISAAKLTCTNKRGDSARIALLPVLGRSLGNMITLNFATKDNYSAGDSTVVINGDDKVKGRWQADTPYTDYYGRAWWALVNLYSTFSPIDSAVIDEAYKMPKIVPNVTKVDSKDYSKAEFTRHRLRKDNRETLSYNVELEIKTDKPDIIIGSALAELCGWVYYGDTKPVMYLFDAEKYPISKFDRFYTPHVGDINRGVFNGNAYTSRWSFSTDGRLSIDKPIKNNIIDETGRGWVICTPISDVTEDVEDEDGNVETIRYQTGGEILLASNTPLPTDTEYFYLDFYVVKN